MVRVRGPRPVSAGTMWGDEALPVSPGALDTMNQQLALAQVQNLRSLAIIQIEIRCDQQEEYLSSPKAQRREKKVSRAAIEWHRHDRVTAGTVQAA